MGKVSGSRGMILTFPHKLLYDRERLRVKCLRETLHERIFMLTLENDNEFVLPKSN